MATPISVPVESGKEVKKTKIEETKKVETNVEEKVKLVTENIAGKDLPKEKIKKMVKTVENEFKTKEVKDTEKKMEKETKAEDKKETKKVEKKAKEIPKKEVAIANGYSLRISPKQSVYVCKIIRGKSPEGAINRLQEVLDERRPVPMAALEVGHKKGKGLAGGKFPKNACKAIMEIVKQAGANAVVAGIESPIITVAKSDRASAPYRRAGRKAKRTHIHLEVRDKSKLMGKKR